MQPPEGVVYPDGVAIDAEANIFVAGGAGQPMRRISAHDIFKNRCVPCVPCRVEACLVCVVVSCQDVTSRSVVVRAMIVSNACMGADDGGGRRPRAGVARHTTAR